MSKLNKIANQNAIPVDAATIPSQADENPLPPSHHNSPTATHRDGGRGQGEGGHHASNGNGKAAQSGAGARPAYSSEPTSHRASEPEQEITKRDEEGHPN